MSERSTSSAERRTDRHRPSCTARMCGVLLFLEEGNRIGLNRLMFESGCGLLGGGREFGVVRNVFDSEQSVWSVCGEWTRRGMTVLTASTAYLSGVKPVDSVTS